MLEVIVLGQIPGTHFQITIGWFAVLLLIFAMYEDYSRLNPQKPQTVKRTRRTA